MKKSTKLLALFLTVIVMMSSFSIMSSAVSSSSSKEDILTYYENCNIKTSAKEDLIKAENTTKVSLTADLSGLTERDKKETLDMYGELEFDDEYVISMYFYGDAYDEYYVDGRSEFIDYFSIKRNIRNWGLAFKSGTYKVASNGEATVTFKCTETFENGDVNTLTFTAKIAKNGYIQSYTLKQVGAYTYESAKGEEFEVTETVVDTYKFIYKKVAVTGIELPESYIELAKDEEYAINAIIYPANATYQDFYVEVVDIDVADWYYDENGNPYIYGVGSGTTTVEVYTYDGDLMAELEVKCTGGSFFSAIIDFFRSIFEFFFGFLMF